MSVSGFEDAYIHSTPIIISKEPFFEVRVPTIPGMAIMKLIAWNDSFPERQKDAQDSKFRLVMNIMEQRYGFDPFAKIKTRA